MMQRELFSKVLLAVADCWPVPGKFQFEIVPFGVSGGCRLVVTSPSQNCTDMVRMSCNFDAATDVRAQVRRMFDSLASPAKAGMHSTRKPQGARP